jgi:hypothetical protein
MELRLESFCFWELSLLLAVFIYYTIGLFCARILIFVLLFNAYLAFFDKMVVYGLGALSRGSTCGWLAAPLPALWWSHH